MTTAVPSAGIVSGLSGLSMRDHRVRSVEDGSVRTLSAAGALKKTEDFRKAITVFISKED
ncbi:MAG: hypothetical protein PHC68_11990 [Syntrophorhabdaceae bacterium]|nr:hypothetical protein [Syntrophorhabdaceae bacterium]